MQIHHFMVMERIDELHREAEFLRTERRMRHRYRGAVRGGIGAAPGIVDGHPPARVRVGNWLIGIGRAVSGSTGDTRGGTAGHAA